MCSKELDLDKCCYTKYVTNTISEWYSVYKTPNWEIIDKNLEKKIHLKPQHCKKMK